MFTHAERYLSIPLQSRSSPAPIPLQRDEPTNRSDGVGEEAREEAREESVSSLLLRDVREGGK